MRAHIRILALSTMLALPAMPFAFAASDEEPIVLSNSPSSAPAKIPAAVRTPAVAQPVTAAPVAAKPAPAVQAPAWTVRVAEVPAALVKPNQKIPCVATKRDESGDFIHLSGGGQYLGGVSFEGKGLNLQSGASVPITLSFNTGGAPIRAVGFAVSPTLVVVNTVKNTDLYTRLSDAAVIKVLLGQGASASELSYKLDGVRTALADMNACYETGKVAATAPVAPPAAPVIADATPTTKRPAKSAPEPTLEISDEPFMPNISLPGAGVPVAPKPALPKPAPVKAPVNDEPVILDQTGSAPPPPPMAPVPDAPAPLPEKKIAALATPKAPQPPSQVLLDAPSKMPQPAPKATSQKTNILVPSKIVDTYRARKGEGLRDVIRRWSDRAGIDLVWTLQADIILDKEYSYVGDFKTALDGLLAQYPQANINTTFAAQGVSAPTKQPYVEESNPPAVPPIHVDASDLDDFVPPMDKGDLLGLGDDVAMPPVDAAPAPKIAPPPMPAVDPVELAAASAPRPAVPQLSQGHVNKPTFGPTKRWRALQGASMREVMQAWADDAGVVLVWQASHDYVVRHSYNMTTDYGQAVNSLLEQYNYQSQRPMGQLFQDPATGKKALVVRTQNG